MLLASFALVLAWLITAATDEGAIAWGVRAGRALPLTPFCAAVGVWGVLAHVHARGEVRALGALGRTPAASGAAAVVGGSLVAIVAAAIVGAVPAVDVSGFYPVATRTAAWEWHDGAFEDRTQGLRLDASGTPSRLEPVHFTASSVPLPARARLAAALATVLSAIALAALTARAVLSRTTDGASPSRGGRCERGLSRDVLVAGLSAAASVALFQSAAAHRASALWAVGPSAALLAFALRRYRAWT
jgi:hypothetical protein